MGVYVLTNGDGSYIRFDELTKKYVPINSFNQAKKWTNLTKVKSVLNNTLTKKIRDNYNIEFIETEELSDKIPRVNIEDEYFDNQKQLVFHEIEEDHINDWQSKINKIKEILSETEGRSIELSEKISEVDKEIVDVEHYIEFGKFNCYQGWICFKMLQNLFKQRRKYKNEMQVLSMIGKCKLKNDSILSLTNAIPEVNNKIYSPRAFPELFGEKN